MTTSKYRKQHRVYHLLVGDIRILHISIFLNFWTMNNENTLFLLSDDDVQSLHWESNPRPHAYKARALTN